MGEVSACVDTSEVNVPPGCCPGQGQNSGRIITTGASLQVDFTINYSGALFSLISATETWDCEVLLEQIGGIPDPNLQKPVTPAPNHIPGGGPVVGSTTIPWTPSKAGNVYKLVFKVTLMVGTTLVVCAFSEGGMVHFNEA